MAITQIATFKAPSGGGEDARKQVLKSLGSSLPQDIAIGMQIQDPDILQLTTSDESSIEDNSAFKGLRSICGEPLETYRTDLNSPLFGPEGPATAPIVEYVASSFPVSRLTPEYTQQIEADFEEFFKACKSVCRGDIGIAWGWSTREQDHVDDAGEKTRPFIVVRGWEKMADFEHQVAQPEFKEVIPILMAWKVPAKLVSLCVCQMGLSSETLTKDSGMSSGSID